MGLLSFLKKKDDGAAKPAPAPRPTRQDTSKGKSGGLIFLILGLLIGGAGGMAGGSFMPEIGRDLLQLEPLVPESNMQSLKDKVASLSKEKMDLEKKLKNAPKQEKNDKPAPRRRRTEDPYIDEIGTRVEPGNEIVRSNDLPVRSAIPQNVQNDNVILDFSKIQLGPADIDRLTRLNKDGVHFFMAFGGDFSKEGYALASNLHDRFPDMPTTLSFFVDKNEHVMLYAAWLAIRLISEEEAWNFLNFAFNSRSFPNANQVLQDYENVNAKFNRKNLIQFWSNHRDELKALLDAPYTIRAQNGFEGYKLPFVTVHGKVQETKLDADSIRNTYKGKIRMDEPKLK